MEMLFTWKLYRARSRLYRSRFFQVNTHVKALAEIYTYTPLHCLNPIWKPWKAFLESVIRAKNKAPATKEADRNNAARLGGSRFKTSAQGTLLSYLDFLSKCCPPKPKFWSYPSEISNLLNSAEFSLNFDAFYAEFCVWSQKTNTLKNKNTTKIQKKKKRMQNVYVKIT